MQEWNSTRDGKETEDSWLYVVRSEDYRLFIKRLGVVVDSVNPANPKDLEYAVNILKQGLRDRIASLTVMPTVGVS